MTKRRIKLALALAILAAVLMAAFYQSTIIGWWRGEAKYHGRYTNSWRAQLRGYEFWVGFRPPGHRAWIFAPKPSRWEQWLGKLLPISYPPDLGFHPPLQDGDPDAVPPRQETFL